jgi:hypothetical protein
LRNVEIQLAWKDKPDWLVRLSIEFKPSGAFRRRPGMKPVLGSASTPFPSFFFFGTF